MPDLEQVIHSLTGVVTELARENRANAKELAADRTIPRETLRELNGFVAKASVALDRLERLVSRLAETTEVGFTCVQLALQDNNQLIVANNAAIRRLLDILARARKRRGSAGVDPRRHDDAEVTAMGLAANPRSIVLERVDDHIRFHPRLLDLGRPPALRRREG